MKKLPFVFSLLIFLFLIFPQNILAVSLGSIGGLDTQGMEYSQWWYTGTDPVLSGTATSGSTVTISVDGVANTVTADSSGNWSFQTSGLTTGNDYAIVIAEGSDSYSFTLTIGAMDSTTSTGSATPSADDLPESGFGAPTIALLVTSGLLVTSPLAIKKYL